MGTPSGRNCFLLDLARSYQPCFDQDRMNPEVTSVAPLPGMAWTQQVLPNMGFVHLPLPHLSLCPSHWILPARTDIFRVRCLGSNPSASTVTNWVVSSGLSFLLCKIKTVNSAIPESPRHGHHYLLVALTLCPSIRIISVKGSLTNYGDRAWRGNTHL